MEEPLNCVYILDILNQGLELLHVPAMATNNATSREGASSLALTAHAVIDAVLHAAPRSTSTRQSVLRALQVTAILDEIPCPWQLRGDDLARLFQATVARLRSQSESWSAFGPLTVREGRIAVVNIPECTVYGASFLVDCILTITRDLAERALGQSIRLGSHVYRPVGHPVVWDGPRSRPVDPQPWTHRLVVPVVIPEDPGVYCVTLHPVIEQTLWGEFGTDPWGCLWVERYDDGSLMVVDCAAHRSTQVRDVPDRNDRVILPPVVDLRGAALFLDPRDQMVSPAVAIGSYEPFETRLVEWLVPAGGTIIDVGAHIGYYTILAAVLAGRNGRVEAFEPDPRNSDLLQRSARVNGFDVIRVHPAAVGEKEGRSLLYRSSFKNTGDHRVYDTGEGRETVDVPVVSLDSELAGRLNRLDLIKIDVQGAEASVLRGAQRVLVEQPGAAILMEFWPFGLKQSEGSVRETLTLLKSANRQLLMIDEENRKLREIPDDCLLRLEEKETYVNLLAVPPSLLTRIPPEWAGEPASVGGVC